MEGGTPPSQFLNTLAQLCGGEEPGDQPPNDLPGHGEHCGRQPHPCHFHSSLLTSPVIKRVSTLLPLSTLAYHSLPCLLLLPEPPSLSATSAPCLLFLAPSAPPPTHLTLLIRHSAYAQDSSHLSYCYTQLSLVTVSALLQAHGVNSAHSCLQHQIVHCITRFTERTKYHPSHLPILSEFPLYNDIFGTQNPCKR